VKLRTSRYKLLVVAVIAALMLSLNGPERALFVGGARTHPAEIAAAQNAGTPAASSVSGEMIGRTEAPRWAFAVLTFQDPYAGQVTRPEEPELGTRYVAAEVVIENPSDQPLEFTVSAVRLRDEAGVEYPATSTVVAAEPKLVGQNLPGGERTRGWVWFVVPQSAVITELKLIAPAPQLRVRLPAPSGD
jgi:hypothetical protein